jgi:hypothetical protein
MVIIIITLKVFFNIFIRQTCSVFQDHPQEYLTMFWP